MYNNLWTLLGTLGGAATVGAVIYYGYIIDVPEIVAAKPKLTTNFNNPRLKLITDYCALFRAPFLNWHAPYPRNFEDCIHSHRFDYTTLLLNHNGLGYLHVCSANNPFAQEAYQDYALDYAIALGYDDVDQTCYDLAELRVQADYGARYVARDRVSIEAFPHVEAYRNTL